MTKKRSDGSGQDRSRPDPSTFQWVNTTHPEQFKDKDKMKEIRGHVMNNYLQRAQHDPESTDRRVLSKRRESQPTKKRPSKSQLDQPTFIVNPTVTPPTVGTAIPRSQPVQDPTPTFSPVVSGHEQYAPPADPPTPVSMNRVYLQQDWSRSATTSSSPPSVSGDDQSTHIERSDSFSSLGSNAAVTYPSSHPLADTPRSVGTPEFNPIDLPPTDLTDMLQLDENFMRSFPMTNNNGLGSSTDVNPQPVDHNELLKEYMKDDVWIDDLPNRDELHQQLNNYLVSSLGLDSDEGLHFSLYQINLKMMQGSLPCTAVFRRGVAGIVAARGGLTALKCSHDLAAKLAITHLISSMVCRTRPLPEYLDFTSTLIHSVRDSFLALSYCPLYAWNDTTSNPSRFSAEITKLLLETQKLITLCSYTNPSEGDIHGILKRVLQSPSGDQPGHADSNDPMYESVRLAAFLGAHAAMRRIPLHEAAAPPDDVMLSSPQAESTAHSLTRSRSHSAVEARRVGASRPTASTVNGRRKQRAQQDNSRSGVTVAMLETRVKKIPSISDIMSGKYVVAGRKDRMDRLAILGVLFWISLVGIASCKPHQAPEDAQTAKPSPKPAPTLNRTSSLSSLNSHPVATTYSARRDSISPLHQPTMWHVEQYPFLPTVPDNHAQEPAYAIPQAQQHDTAQSKHDHDIVQPSQRADQDASRRFFSSLAIRTAALIRKEDSAAVLRRLERFVGFLAFLDERSGI